MTQAELAAVAAALDAATEAEARMTPGEWGTDQRGCCVWTVDTDIHIAMVAIGGPEGTEADAAGIALARNRWPALLRLARAVTEYRQIVEQSRLSNNLKVPSITDFAEASAAVDAALLALGTGDTDTEERET